MKKLILLVLLTLSAQFSFADCGGCGSDEQQYAQLKSLFEVATRPSASALVGSWRVSAYVDYYYTSGLYFNLKPGNTDYILEMVSSGRTDFFTGAPEVTAKNFYNYGDDESSVVSISNRSACFNNLKRAREVTLTYNRECRMLGDKRLICKSTTTANNLSEHNGLFSIGYVGFMRK